MALPWQERMPNIIDFSRSFLTFRIDALKKPPRTASHEPPYSLNNARIQIECRLSVTDKETQATQTFVMGASCKTERVGVDGDIWTSPNADFVPIFSDSEFMHIKTYASAGIDVELYPRGSGRQSDRQRGRTADAFDSLRVDIADAPGAELDTDQEIVAATLANAPLVAVTMMESDRYSATLEYPVKTMNANERDMIYQTDTGPILFPNLENAFDSMLSGLELAFIAFNCRQWAEVLIRVPTRIDHGGTVYHYSQPRRITGTNRLFRRAD